MQRCLVKWGNWRWGGPHSGPPVGAGGRLGRKYSGGRCNSSWSVEGAGQRATVGPGPPAVTFILGRSWGLVLRVEGTNLLERKEDGVSLVMSRDLESGLIFFSFLLWGAHLSAQRLLLAL